MVLTRANLEKTRKRRNNIYVSWKLFKVKWQRNTMDKQLTQVEKTLKRMESQLVVSRSVNEAFQNWIISLGKQCWKNKQYLGRERIETVGISDTTNETKVCELIETATGYFNKPWQSRSLPSLTFTFSRRKDAEMVLSKKNKTKASILVVRVASTLG